MPFLLADTPLTQLDNTGKPERKQWLAMISLSLVSFVVSLDATILVTALPVRCGVQKIACPSGVLSARVWKNLSRPTISGSGNVEEGWIVTTNQNMTGWNST